MDRFGICFVSGTRPASFQVWTQDLLFVGFLSYQLSKKQAFRNWFVGFCFVCCTWSWLHVHVSVFSRVGSIQNEQLIVSGIFGTHDCFGVCLLHVCVSVSTSLQFADS